MEISVRNGFLCACAVKQGAGSEKCSHQAPRDEQPLAEREEYTIGGQDLGLDGRKFDFRLANS